MSSRWSIWQSSDFEQRFPQRDHVRDGRAAAVHRQRRAHQACPRGRGDQGQAANVLTGSIFEQSFRSGDKYRAVRIDSTEATYLYSDGTHHHFMDTKTYDQVAVDEEMLESILPLLKDGSTVFLQRYQDRLIGVELPINVHLKVESTDPGCNGDTMSGATKP